MNERIIYITSPNVMDKKSLLFNKILSLYPDSDYSSIMYIGPNAFILTEAKRQFFSFLKKSNKKLAYIPFRSFTLKDLAASIDESFGKGGIIPEHIRILMLCEILKERDIGHAVILSKLLQKVRHYLPEKTLSQFKDEVKHLIFEEKVLQRVEKAVKTLEKYEEEIVRRGFVDTEEVMKNCLTLMRSESERFSSLKIETLVIDGFYDPTPLELRLIEEVIERAKRVYAIVEDDTELLNFLQSYKSRFKTITLKGRRLRENPVCYAYPSMEEEVDGIAKRIKAMILEGTRAEEIIVTFPSIQKYLSMLKRVFQKHGIPFSIAQYDLSNEKAIVAVKDMVTSIEEDYPRTEFLSFLTSLYFPKIPQVVREWAVAYSNRAGIIKGKDTWLSLRDRVLNSKEEISENEKSLLNEIQKVIKSVIESLERIKHSRDLISFVDELESTLIRFGFFDSLIEYGLSEILEAINNRFAELRRFALVFDSDLRGLNALGYLRYLLTGIEGRDEQKGGVNILPYEFAAVKEAKAMFFGGLIDGEFPSKPEIDPILPEKVKKALGMPYLEYYMDRQRRYFQRLLNVSLHEPYLTFPSQEGDKIFLPSPFFEWKGSLPIPHINISTEEEILIAEGLAKQRNFAEALWNGEVPMRKDFKSLLTRYFGQDCYIRVTDIDEYRKCPLRFYIEKVLKLEIERPPRFEVEAMLWGILAHRVMEYLYKDGDVDIKDINKRILEGLEQALKDLPFGGFWAGVAREIFIRLIPKIEARELDIRMQGFSPYTTEKTIKTEIKGLKLKGKIDRIDKKKVTKRATGQGGKELLESSNPRTLESCSVILLDYKTSWIDKDSLQLPIYAAMWQTENKEDVERVGFYSLKDGSVEWFPKKGVNMDEFIENALQTTEEIIEKMREGIFAPTPSQDTECRFCKHSALCKKLN